jgi:hypothetical protein
MNKGRYGNPQSQINAGEMAGVAKAWVQFGGVTSNGRAPILAHFNVRSVTRTAQGKYTVFFLRPFPTPNYGLCGTASDGGNTLCVSQGTVPPDGMAANVWVANPGTAFVDATHVFVVFYGDQ